MHLLKTGNIKKVTLETMVKLIQKVYSRQKIRWKPSAHDGEKRFPPFRKIAQVSAAPVREYWRASSA